MTNEGKHIFSFTYTDERGARYVEYVQGYDDKEGVYLDRVLDDVGAFLTGVFGYTVSVEHGKDPK